MITLLLGNLPCSWQDLSRGSIRIGTAAFGPGECPTSSSCPADMRHGEKAAQRTTFLNQAGSATSSRLCAPSTSGATDRERIAQQVSPDQALRGEEEATKSVWRSTDSVSKRIKIDIPTCLSSVRRAPSARWVNPKARNRAEISIPCLTAGSQNNRPRVYRGLLEQRISARLDRYMTPCTPGARRTRAPCLKHAPASIQAECRQKLLLNPLQAR